MKTSTKTKKEKMDLANNFMLVSNISISNPSKKQNVTDSRKVLFETTYANMKECGKKGSGKYVASIPIELLMIDFSYQRIATSTPARLKKLANHWREDKLMPMIVVAHPEEYGFCIVDGLHRL